MRLIDADAFVKDILTAGIGKTIIEYSESDIGYMIHKRPTADAAPVRHGRWRFCGSDKWNDAYECSECGNIAMDDSNYCPNCGVKMDLED